MGARRTVIQFSQFYQPAKQNDWPRREYSRNVIPFPPLPRQPRWWQVRQALRFDPCRLVDCNGNARRHSRLEKSMFLNFLFSLTCVLYLLGFMFWGAKERQWAGFSFVLALGTLTAFFYVRRLALWRIHAKTIAAIPSRTFVSSRRRPSLHPHRQRW
jgi:hypothetical protein